MKMATMMSGQPLTDEELIAQTRMYLDSVDPMATDSFAMGDTTGTDVTGMTPDPNYQNGATPTAPLPQQVNSQPARGFGVLDFQTSPPVDDFSYLEDPYSNLSKTQRRMLAFSAIKDAGMALQGKEGNSYATMMADITARADMARKAKAAQAQAERDRLMQQQVLALLGGAGAGTFVGGTVIGGTGVGGGTAGEQDIASYDGRIAALDNAAAQAMATGQADVAQAMIMQRDSLIRQRDELVAENEAEKAQAAMTAEQVSKLRAERGSARDALDAAERALAASLDIKQSEVANAVASGEVDPSKFVWSRLPFGSMAESRSWKDFNAAVTQLGSMMTFQNLAAILEAGAKLGTLSDSDIALIGSISGQIDAQNAPEQTAQTVLRAYKKLQETLAAIDAAELDLLMEN